MLTFSKRTKRAAAVVGVVALGSIAYIAPAQAGAISIGGDSNFSVTAVQSVNRHSVSVGGTVTANGTVTFSAHVLGVPLPVTGYYQQSFPYMPFARPTLLSYNANLGSTSYSYRYDSYTGAYAWMVSGSSDFWGDKSVNLQSSAKADTRGTTGYVRTGSGTGHSVDANSLDYVSCP